MGFFGSLPAAANREQGANKRKSMDLRAQPAQPEPRQVHSHQSPYGKLPAPCVVGPLKSYLCANDTHSHRLSPGLAVLAPCKMSRSHGCNNMTRQKPMQSDRWVEGHDPELFNLRRKTSKDDALDSILLPPQNAGSGRSAPRSQAALPPQKDLPPHLLDQGASRQVSSPISYRTPATHRPCIMNMTRSPWAFMFSSLQEHPSDSV